MYITIMKRTISIILSFVAVMLATPVKAQFDWGIKGGVNLGNNDLTVLREKSTALDVSNYTGFFVGPKIEARIPVVGIGVETAVLYAHKGMTLTKNETFKQNYLQIPLNIKYTLGLGNVANIFIAAGPEFGFNVGETSILVNNIKTDKVTNVTTGDITAYIAEKSTLSINLGMGFTLLKHIQIGVNYNMPWGKTGEFVYIEASEVENAENLRSGENITIDNVKALAGTIEKIEDIYGNIMSGTIQISAAYLF